MASVHPRSSFLAVFVSSEASPGRCPLLADLTSIDAKRQEEEKERKSGTAAETILPERLVARAFLRGSRDVAEEDVKEKEEEEEEGGGGRAEG
ncbi:hypothetical protein HZH68_009223 [Vespula germanica]|uniref:Uncharacterized protein n=1 Tax=Vespula germanica TaxID=30212 RepID=A0A834JUZ0_VESGE|nr:hypothetical protein HZH68_009223 [Vespula germanica]